MVWVEFTRRQDPNIKEGSYDSPTLLAVAVDGFLMRGAATITYLTRSVIGASKKANKDLSLSRSCCTSLTLTETVLNFSS